MIYLNTLKKQSYPEFHKPFSHIYVEKNVLENDITRAILSRFTSSEIIEIDRYKDVFNRKNQRFALQKAHQSLILGEKHNDLVYKGAPFCQSFGNDNFYYTSFVLNCIYDCEYCYLRGMYPSGNIVTFVNTEDYFREIENISQGKEIFLCISYDTDLAAMEGLFGFCGLWYEFAKTHKNITIELRTKSADMGFLEGLEPLENFIIALTLSPESTAQSHEYKAPSLEKRLSAGKKVLKTGFPLRLSFDPVLSIDNYEEIYKDFVCKCFSAIPPEKVKDIGLGSFRISPTYLKNMRKNYPASLIAAYPYVISHGAYTYPEEKRRQLISFVESCIKKYINADKIYLWDT